ncbi:MAG: SprB repeat-containing protein, partial [Cyanobacteria bacterium J06626_26]
DLAEPVDDCPGTNIDLIPIVNGGEGAYEFSWSTGSQDSIEQILRAPGDSTIILTVTDACEQTQMDTVLLETPDIRATLNGVYSLCDGPVVRVPILLSGGTNYTLTIREDGQDVVLTASNTDTLWLEYTDPVNIQTFTVSADGCDGVATGSAAVTDSEFDISAMISDVNCFDGDDGSIEVEVNGNSSGYTFDWDNPNAIGFNPSGLEAGTYMLRVTDAAGCFADTSFVVNQPTDSVSITSIAIEPQTCEADASISVAISGGQTPDQVAITVYTQMGSRHYPITTRLDQSAIETAAEEIETMVSQYEADKPT